MIRAVETADIIKGQLAKDLPVSTDPLLCEGAPIPPEPPVGDWKPELYVNQSIFDKFFLLQTKTSLIKIYSSFMKMAVV